MAPWRVLKVRLALFPSGERCLCLDATDGQTLLPKTPHKGRKNNQIQDLLRQEGGGKRIWNLSEQVRGTTGHHGAKAKGCQRHCLYMCGVAQHDEDSPGWGRQGTEPRK